MSKPSLSISLFILSTFSIFLLLILRNYNLLQTQFIFNEHATNFLQYSLTEPLLFNVLHPDAGYFPLLPRIITLSLVNVLHLTDYYPLLSNAFGFLIIALCCSLVNLKPFDKYISSTPIRFLLGISLGTALNNELFYFFNFSYYGIIFLIYAISLEKETLNKYVFTLLTLGSVIIILSKGIFIALFPIYCFALFFQYRKKKSRIYYATLLLTTLIQTATVLYHTATNGSSTQVTFLGLYLLKSIRYLWQTYDVFFSPFYMTRTLKYALLLLLALVIYFAYRKKQLKMLPKELWIFLLLLNGIALSSLFLNITFNGPLSTTEKELLQTFNLSLLWKELLSSPFGNIWVEGSRHFFISNVAVFISGIVLISYYIRRRILFSVLSVYFLFMSGIFGVFVTMPSAIIFTNQYANWSQYSHLLTREQYCIPVSYYPQLLKKDCNFLHDPFLFSTQNEIKDRLDIMAYYPDSPSWEVLGLVIQNNSSRPIVIYLHDESGRILSKASSINGASEFKYYLLNKSVTNIASVSFYDKDGVAISIPPRLAFFGRNTTAESTKINYENIMMDNKNLFSPKLSTNVDAQQSVTYLFSSHRDKLSGIFFPSTTKNFNPLNNPLIVYDATCKYALRNSFLRLEDEKLIAIFEPIEQSKNKQYCLSINNNKLIIKTMGILYYHNPDLSGK